MWLSTAAVLATRKNGAPNNVAKVIQKILRMAMCVHGYFNTTKGEVIFASPKIHPRDWSVLEPREREIAELFKTNGLGFTVKIIANDKFKEEVMEWDVQLLEKKESPTVQRLHCLTGKVFHEDSDGGFNPGEVGPIVLFRVSKIGEAQIINQDVL